MLRFSPKTTNESYPVAFGFENILNDLAPGENITGVPTVTATVLIGTDATPQAIVSGAAQVSGTDVLQRIIAGVIGVTYLLACKVTTDKGNTFEVGVTMAVTKAGVILG